MTYGDQMSAGCPGCDSLRVSRDCAERQLRELVRWFDHPEFAMEGNAQTIEVLTRVTVIMQERDALRLRAQGLEDVARRRVDEIATSWSRVHVLETALRPFAEKWDRAMDCPKDERFNPGVLCSLGEFKAAAAALNVVAPRPLTEAHAALGLLHQLPHVLPQLRVRVHPRRGAGEQGARAGVEVHHPVLVEVSRLTADLARAKGKLEALLDPAMPDDLPAAVDYMIDHSNAGWVRAGKAEAERDFDRRHLADIGREFGTNPDAHAADISTVACAKFKKAEAERDVARRELEALRRAAQKVLDEFAPEHLDRVSGTNVGEELRLLLSLPEPPAEPAPAALQTREEFACTLCGNWPNAAGELEHGKGCTAEEARGGGGIEYVEMPRELYSKSVQKRLAAREPDPAGTCSKCKGNGFVCMFMGNVTACDDEKCTDQRKPCPDCAGRKP